MVARESNMTLNSLALMDIAGFFAVVGIVTDALHVVSAS